MTKKGICYHHSGFICSKLSEPVQIKHAQRIFKERYTYHFIITRAGSVFQGHALTEVVGHAANQKLVGDVDRINEEYIGVCFLGNFTKEKWTKEQLYAFSYIFSEVRRQIGKELGLLIHKEVSHTACPGALSKTELIQYVKKSYITILTKRNNNVIVRYGRSYMQLRYLYEQGLCSGLCWDANKKEIIIFK